VQASDITVEVRDIDLNRVGIIRPEDLDIALDPEHNRVGSWEITLAAEHPLGGVLRTPGSGIIVTGPNDVIISGPTTTPTFASSSNDPIGTVTIKGVGDSIVLADMLSFPDPTNIDPTTQTLSHDVRTGNIETIMHGYVNANIGPGAPAARRKAKLIMGTNGARGPVVTKRARFPVLGTLLYDLAVVAGLGFRIVQRNSNLVFETFQVLDRSAEIRLDVRNDTLASATVAFTPPGATQVIVAGQGELTERQFYAATSSEALAAEAEWGRRIERFVDQRQTDDPNEHIQAAAEVLQKEGFTGVAVKAVPTDDTTMRYGIDWGLGDLVTVVIDDGEAKSLVTGIKIRIGPDGTFLGAVLGDPAEFDAGASASARLKDVERRVAYLETADAIDPAVISALDERIAALEAAP